MEGVSKPDKHEPRRATSRSGQGEIKAVRVVSNQKYKHRGDIKPARDGDGASPVSGKKQAESYNENFGGLKTCKENSTICTTGSKELEPSLLVQSQLDVQKLSPQQSSNTKQPAGSEHNATDPKYPRPLDNCTGTKQVNVSAGAAVSESKCSVMAATANKSPENNSLMEATHVEARTAVQDPALAEEELGLKQAEERVERDFIYRLEKRSPLFPNCQYYCKLCYIHIENIPGAHKHIKEKRHKKNILEKQEENELRNLPPPSSAQITALEDALRKTVKEHGISQEDFAVRQEIVCEMEKIIQTKLEDCSLRMYGSSLTRFAFKASDINIDIKFPLPMSQPDVLIQALDILKNSVHYTNVESDFHAKVPVVFCKDIKSGLVCKVSAGNDTACLTTELLATVGRLEPVLIPLVVAFRYWAKLCHIDCQTEGGIPSYSFALMVLFFLQKRKRPILPAYLGSWIDGFETKKLDDYCLKGVSEERFLHWEYKLANSENKNSFAVDGRERAEQQNHRRSSEAENRRNREKQGKSPLVFKHRPNVLLGQLWLELLRFYTLEFAMEDNVISVRVQNVITRESKNWPRRRIAIEDPFALKRNVARSLNSQMVYEYIVERFRSAYRYFACPQSKELNKSKIDSRKRAKLNSQKSSAPSDLVANGSNIGSGSCESVEQGEKSRCGLEEACNGPLSSSLMEVTNNLHSLIVDNNCNDHHQEEQSVEHFSEEEDSNVTCNGKELLATKDTHNTTEGMSNAGTDCAPDATSPSVTEGNLSEQDLQYVFDQFIFTSGKPPTIVCSICKRDGHSKDDCPEDFKKIDLNPLPPMTARFREILDRVCKRCFDELSPNACEQQNREQILAHLERFIRKEFNGNARLCLFGSSKNGFGFRDSDLDICMTLEGHENAEKLNCKEIIEGLAKVLKRHPGLKNILPITTAKVPIVKFEHRESGVEGDISLYNTLAQHNTRMLATYAAIDPRVKYLGYTVKFFAKRCDIGDASRGSLSSYAYILMVLYFLQQRKPPVIPVLQERNRFPSLGKNAESVGELWLGFLRFYTEEFDFKENVISIRQKKLLTTFEKQWTSKCIAIEDPFDLNHNLGAGVSRKMTNFIMKAFINGRKLFGIPYYPQPGYEAEYFFDSKVLTDGELAPNDRCCRVCGKIGHYMKDCPKRRRIKKKENERDDDKDLKEEERDPRERRCFMCGDVGHFRRDCPENNPMRQKNNSLMASQLLQILQQPVLQPLQQVELPSRTRNTSESSESHHSSYSPQPQAFPQAQSTPSKLISQQKPPAQNPHQVQRNIFNFSHSPPTHYSALHNLGLLPLQPQIPIPNSSWPIHGQMLRCSSGKPPHPGGVPFPVRSGSSTPSTTNQSAVNLNDPSIIFAQPAARSLGVPNSTHDGQWHSSQPPSTLVSNGTTGSTDQGFQGQFGKPRPPWDRGGSAHIPLLPASWPYNLPQNFLQQGPSSFHSKPFYSPGASLIQNGQQLPVLSQGHPHLNSSYIQQKK
ncbi:terminal uridylyltransferase 4 isoform X2 [Bombina bombina]|uniref:terminal uridylyltransferase 4 isoform X2 n=1 Tax=Bombina bombina TaxID=8345 RepID=UPI00235A64DC|nr:terminal uridylyltransferase 4 isoform X2 [Bombina bombina]